MQHTRQFLHKCVYHFFCVGSIAKLRFTSVRTILYAVKILPSFYVLAAPRGVLLASISLFAVKCFQDSSCSSWMFPETAVAAGSAWIGSLRLPPPSHQSLQALFLVGRFIYHVHNLSTCRLRWSVWLVGCNENDLGAKKLIWNCNQF